MKPLRWIKQSAHGFIPLCLFFLMLLGANAQLLPPEPTCRFLDGWTFDDKGLTSAYGEAPASATNLALVAGGDNTSLLVENTNVAWLRLNVFEQDGRTNLSLPNGTISFWFSPDWSSTNQAGGTGPNCWARMIELGSYDTNGPGWLGLFFDPSGSHIYFSAQTNGCDVTYIACPISWSSNEWHAIALTYCPTNTSLYLDGMPATNGSGLTCWPGLEVLTNGFYVGSDSTGSNQMAGRLDDLFIYDGPMDPGNVAGYFELYSIVYYGFPVSLPLAPAPSTPSYGPAYNAITGPGVLRTNGSAATCVSGGSIWITNAAATTTTNGTTISFEIQGGSDGIPYDVFATSSLTGSSITNSLWTWMGQGYQCVNYSLTITNQPNVAAFLVLGTPQDSDRDGLTDAFEELVSKTSAFNPDTDGDGISDSDEVLNHTDPLTPNPAVPSGSLNPPTCPQ